MKLFVSTRRWWPALLLVLVLSACQKQVGDPTTSGGTTTGRLTYSDSLFTCAALLQLI